MKTIKYNNSDVLTTCILRMFAKAQIANWNLYVLPGKWCVWDDWGDKNCRRCMG